MEGKKYPFKERKVKLNPAVKQSNIKNVIYVQFKPVLGPKKICLKCFKQCLDTWTYILQENNCVLTS